MVAPRTTLDVLAFRFLFLFRTYRSRRSVQFISQTHTRMLATGVRSFSSPLSFGIHGSIRKSVKSFSQ